MNIETKTSPKGITASGTINGKRRQVTTAVDTNISKARNHGRAAAAFANKFTDSAEQRRLGTSVTTVQAKWEKTLTGFRFTFPDA